MHIKNTFVNLFVNQILWISTPDPGTGSGKGFLSIEHLHPGPFKTEHSEKCFQPAFRALVSQMKGGDAYDATH